MKSWLYDELLDRHRAAYDESAAARRDTAVKQEWKQAERSAFRDRLRAAGASTLLEVGSGSGQDSAWFREHGFDVTAVDASPAMVELTRAKGVPARLRHVLDLGLPAESFDAVYSINTLLHVPNEDLDAALRAIHDVLAPGGLFFLGVYGGAGSEGISATDSHDPPRFFSLRTDQDLLAYASKLFEVADFHVVQASDEWRFQSLTLRRAA
jgi:SAM-dependent methyltransferase